VLRQIRGGLDKTPEGVLLITTTQSDDIPAGAFKSELKLARNVRDGLYRGKVMRPLLPMLYEFPREIACRSRSNGRIRKLADGDAEHQSADHGQSN
jgi:phage terminase large subunit-like protein